MAAGDRDRVTLVGRNTALAVQGLKPLMRALDRTADGAGKHLRRELRGVGKFVQGRARANAPVGPRPKRSNTKPLRGSIRASATLKGVSVYSDEEHALVQDRGGHVGRYGPGGYGATVLQRNRVSGYMTRAVEQAQPEVSRRLQGVLDSVGRDFEK